MAIQNLLRRRNSALATSPSDSRRGNMDEDSDSSWTLAVRRRTLKTQRTEERVKQKYKTTYTCPKPTPAMWQTILPNLDAPAPIRVGWSAEKTLSTLESIPVELRQQIWKSLLTFDGVLHHRLRFLPFLQTGQSYKYREKLAEDVRSILPPVRSECAYASLWERHDSGMAVLSLNARLFSVAIVVFTNVTLSRSRRHFSASSVFVRSYPTRATSPLLATSESSLQRPAGWTIEPLPPTRYGLFTFAVHIFAASQSTSRIWATAS